MFLVKADDPPPVTDPVTGQRTLTAAWQTGLSNAVQVGSILGLMMNG